MGNWGTMGGVMASFIITGRGPPCTWVYTSFFWGISYPRHPIIPSENDWFGGVQAHPKRIGPYSSLGSMISIIPFQNFLFYPCLGISLWFLQIVIEEVRNKKILSQIPKPNCWGLPWRKNLISWVENFDTTKNVHKKKARQNSSFCDKFQVYQVFCEPSKSSSNKFLHPVDAPGHPSTLNIRQLALEMPRSLRSCMRKVGCLRAVPWPRWLKPLTMGRMEYLGMLGVICYIYYLL